MVGELPLELQVIVCGNIFIEYSNHPMPPH